MNTILKVFLSMSCSGALLILALFLLKRVLKNKISRQWQYYIWLVAVLRLLLPFGLEISLLGKVYQALDQTITESIPSPQQSAPQQPLPSIPESNFTPAAGTEPDNEQDNSPTEDFTPTRPFQELKALLFHPVWLVLLIWLVVALSLLIRKITIYQGFAQYIRAGWTPVSDTRLLDQLSLTAERLSMKKPIELAVNPFVSSPLLIGFFRPCIVLPSTDIPEKNVPYILLHELIHYKRRDMFYKWLVQITICLHWFNPLVYFMSREITKACEFSCDEAVLTTPGSSNAQDYGKTLLDAMAAVGAYKENLGVVTLSENKQLLKERLGAIMNFKKKSKTIRLLTGILTLCMVFGAALIGIYPVTAATRHTAAKSLVMIDNNRTPENTDTSSNRYSQTARKYYDSWMAEKYYKAGSLPLFELTFSRLDKGTQKKWLEKLYTDGDFAFFSVALRGLDEASSLPADFAEKAYADEDMAFFSTLTDCMEEAELELWLDRTLEDENWAFQSILFNKLNRDDEFDELEETQKKEWEETQKTEYAAVGVTMDGKNYYYQGQLVHVFLDIRSNQSLYTLNINPKGTVNIKLLRNKNNKITDVIHMTEAEVRELLEDMEEDDAEDDEWEEEADEDDGWKDTDWNDSRWNSSDWENNDWTNDDWENNSEQNTAEGRTWYPQVIPVDIDAIAAGEIVWLGEYTLSEGDRLWYAVSAETGKGLQVGFAKPEDTDLNTAYCSVKNLRQGDEALECIASLKVKSPVKPGTYQLFLRATDGALGNVRGSISIGFLADAS